MNKLRSLLVASMFLACAASAAMAGTVTISVLDASGQVLASASADGDNAAASVKLARKYQAGDVIRIEGGPNLAVKLSAAGPEQIVYCPRNVFLFPVPSGRNAGPFNPAWFKGERHDISARLVKAEELAAVRNLAANPYDTLESACFPHASASNYYTAKDPMPIFAPRNAIDGERRNDGHGGWPVQSWGPDRLNDLWFRIDFGRPVEIDKLVFTLRAQFPPVAKSDHDDVWQSAVIEFSDGSSEKVEFKKTGDRQEFPVAKRTVTWLKMTKIVLPKSNKWAALTELEAWGRDARPAKP